MIDFLSGAVALAFLLAGVYFLRFWRRTRDRLFLHFAVAFWLFMLNQILATIFGSGSERDYTYILRVLGFIWILVAIVDKNTFAPKSKRHES
jgi:hypothetical protein